MLLYDYLMTAQSSITLFNKELHNHHLFGLTPKLTAIAPPNPM
jgi:hypothetical protein